MFIEIEKLPNPYLQNIWSCNQQLSMEMVRICLEEGLTRDEPLLPYSLDNVDVMAHSMRVASFIKYGWDDNELAEVEIHYTPNNEPYLWLVDFNHRLAALIFLGFEYVECYYNEDVEKYLSNDVVKM